MEKLVYSVKDVANLLNIGMNKAYDLINQKEIPVIKMGRTIRIPKKAFESWLNSIS